MADLHSPIKVEFSDVKQFYKGLSRRDYIATAALTGAQQWDAIINGKNSAYAQPGGTKKLAAIC